MIDCTSIQDEDDRRDCRDCKRDAAKEVRECKAACCS